METYYGQYDWKDRLQDDGTWQKTVGKIREEWAEVTDQELEEARGNWEQLVGTIKQKTGETAETIEAKFAEWFDNEQEVV